ncbi:hypothetical protein NPIL_35911 [Nephila pilipes]|uniref:Uncharacterized protein n=1 Tax=Nephila pilipes TaxID=299642 RepID=A0A8X6NHT6_NEPPI|nr:hypothetical protein NPIL_35911 [Nephila pilipes]
MSCLARKKDLNVRRMRLAPRHEGLAAGVKRTVTQAILAVRQFGGWDLFRLNHCHDVNQRTSPGSCRRWANLSGYRFDLYEGDRPVFVDCGTARENVLNGDFVRQF